MGQGSSQPAHLQDPELEQESDMHSTKSDASPPPPVNKPNRESRPPNGSLPKRKRAPSQSVASPVAATTPEDRPSALKRKRVVDNLGKQKTPTPNGQRDTGGSSSQKTRVNQSSAGPGPGLFSKEISAGRLNRALSATANGGSPARSTVSEGLNKGRLHRSNGEAGKNGLTGAFQPDEVEALEEFKVRFCNSYGLSTTTFDLIVQHGKGPFPGPPGVTKYTFWQEVHSILPNRDKRSVRRFMKRHFQASNQKPHEWTEEQEDELVVLYRQNGPKWAYISELLGRSSDDVVQRWKNRLEHRSTMNVGPWSEAELSLLKEVLRDAWSKMQKQGYDVGSNIYEMDESLISWGQVSVRMKHTRSRQQCADKWRRVKGSRVAQGSQGNSRANSQSLSRSATPLQAKREVHRARKSAAYVVSDDDSDAGDNAVNEKDAAENSKRGTPASKTLNKPKKIESKEEESGSSSESDSESESETMSKSGSATLNKKSNSSEKKASTPKRKQLSSTSSEESDSSSESDSDPESDSGSAGNNKTISTLQKHEEPKVADASKLEASSDESDDSSSEEESESDSENESPDEIPATPSPEPTTEETSKGAKRRRSNSTTTEAAEAGDKRVKVKKERSPTPSGVVAPEHENESESREQDAKILKRESTAESETSSESESESNEQDAKKREGSSESETSSDSDAESDSSDSSAGDEAERENTPTKRHPEPEDVEMKQNSLSDYEVSSDSDADSTSSSDPEDEPSKDGPNVTGKAELADAAPAIKKENDSDSTSSSGSSSDSDSDSDSE